MPKPGTECAVVDRATNLQQQIGAPAQPADGSLIVRERGTPQGWGDDALNAKGNFGLLARQIERGAPRRGN
jgi:hypothetical protein